MSDWILVVDDDTANLKMASRILSREKMRVSCMKSGEDAIKFLQENKPDLVLLDVHMPGMDGFETISHLSSNEKTVSIPAYFQFHSKWPSIPELADRWTYKNDQTCTYYHPPGME